MRTLTIVLALMLLIVVGCGKKAEEKTDASYLDDEKKFLPASNKLVSNFSAGLGSELRSALKEGGPVGAIEVCHNEASVIAAAHSGEYWSIRRVSDRNRNPENSANEHEIAVMASFQDTASPGYFHEWVDTESKPLFRYYHPIRIGPICTKCHGGEDAIDADVKAVLAELYPDDKAVGYKPGDLRGMFVVEIQWPEGKDFAYSYVGRPMRFLSDSNTIIER